jgi:hypothetical protein
MENFGYNHESYIGQAYYTRGTWGMSPGESNPGYRGNTAEYYTRHLLNPGYRGEPRGFPQQADWGGYGYPGYGTNPGGYWGDRTPASPYWSANAQSAEPTPMPRPYPRPLPDHPNRPGSTQSYRGVGPRSYRRSDQKIQEEVEDRFTDDPHLNPSNLEITTREGVVTLTGTVPDRGQKRRAEDLAESVAGVRDVENHLMIENRR